MMSRLFTRTFLDIAEVQPMLDAAVTLDLEAELRVYGTLTDRDGESVFATGLLGEIRDNEFVAGVDGGEPETLTVEDGTKFVIEFFARV